MDSVFDRPQILSYARTVQSPTDLEELDTIDDVEKIIINSKQDPSKVFVILFNILKPTSKSIEMQMENIRLRYETTGRFKFLKCVVPRDEKIITSKFKIQRKPTFIIFREGKEIRRIDDLNESNPSKRLTDAESFIDMDKLLTALGNL